MAEKQRVADLTVDELLILLRHTVREVLQETRQIPASHPRLDDFPIDDLGPWPEGLTLTREEMYDADGR